MEIRRESDSKRPNASRYMGIVSTRFKRVDSAEFDYKIALDK